MAIKLFRCVAAISALVSSIFANAETANITDSITVSGQVINIPVKGSRSIIINECDTYKKDVRRVADLDSLGRFCERIPFSSAHTFTINYKRSLFINAFAVPGDSIHVVIDASTSPLEFHLSGDHAKMNEEYSHAFLDLAPIYGDVKLLSDTAALADYMPTFKNEVSKKREMVDKYITDNSISDEVAGLLHTDNIFIIANQAIGFRGKNDEEQLKFFTDPLFDILNEDNAKVMIFPYHFHAFCHNFPEYIRTVPKGHIRDLMYASAGEEYKPKREEFADQAYYDRIYNDVSAKINLGLIKPGDIIVTTGDSITHLTNQNPMKWLAEQYPNKYIYLDISATWCGPCREALAGSEGVREHFKDSNIVFVILWLRSNLKTWEKIAPTITNATQIFITDDDMSNRLMGAFNVDGFPSSYLLCPNGEILHDDVPGIHHSSLPDYLKSKL